MPYVRHPRSDSERVTLLERIKLAAADDAASSVVYLLPNMVAEVDRLFSRIRTLYDERRRHQQDYTEKVVQKDAAYEELKTHVRDFWEVLARRIHRKKLTREVFEYYNLPQSGERPNPTSEDEWMTWSRDAVRGENDAIADGQIPMSNPSGAEVEMVRVTMRSKLAAVRHEDAELDRLQHEWDAIRPEVDQLIRTVSLQMNIALIALPPDDIRHIKRRYGFTYVYVEGETPEDDSDVPADEEDVVSEEASMV